MASKSHGLSKTQIYGVWNAMKARCTNKNTIHYSEYGGRGITVCREWMESFEAFHADMGERPRGASIERLDNNKGYSPDNCVWATKKEQARNRRGRHYLTVGAETKTMAEWAEAQGIGIRTVWNRVKLGWTHEDAVMTPVWGAGRGSGSNKRATAALRGVNLPAWQAESP